MDCRRRCSGGMMRQEWRSPAAGAVDGEPQERASAWRFLRLRRVVLGHRWGRSGEAGREGRGETGSASRTERWNCGAGRLRRRRKTWSRAEEKAATHPVPGGACRPGWPQRKRDCAVAATPSASGDRDGNLSLTLIGVAAAWSGKPQGMCFWRPAQLLFLPCMAGAAASALKGEGPSSQRGTGPGADAR